MHVLFSRCHSSENSRPTTPTVIPAYAGIHALVVCQPRTTTPTPFSWLVASVKTDMSDCYENRHRSIPTVIPAEAGIHLQCLAISPSKNGGTNAISFQVVRVATLMKYSEPPVIPSVARNPKCSTFVIWAIGKAGRDDYRQIPSPLTREGWSLPRTRYGGEGDVRSRCILYIPLSAHQT